jgi:hypothetical protein
VTGENCTFIFANMMSRVVNLSDFLTLLRKQSKRETYNRRGQNVNSRSVYRGHTVVH